jgi:nucleotide-binding universal stress UspA family protein
MKISVKRILCPVDFSETSDHALQYALAFAEAYGAELQLLHIVERPMKSYDEVLETAGCIDSLMVVQQKCREQLARIADQVGEGYRNVTYHMGTGVPFVEIIRSARANGVDLVVMGTHGAGDGQYLLIGSVAQRVVSKAPCPVLTVRHPQHEFVMP